MKAFLHKISLMKSEPEFKEHNADEWTKFCNTNFIVDTIKKIYASVAWVKLENGQKGRRLRAGKRLEDLWKFEFQIIDLNIHL